MKRGRDEEQISEAIDPCAARCWYVCLNQEADGTTKPGLVDNGIQTRARTRSSTRRVPVTLTILDGWILPSAPLPWPFSSLSEWAGSIIRSSRYSQVLTRLRAFASPCTQWWQRAVPMQHDRRPSILSDLQLRLISRHLRNVPFRARANYRDIAGLTLPLTDRLPYRHQYERHSFRIGAVRADSGAFGQNLQGRHHSKPE